MKNEEKYSVYMHTFPNGKRYVGITRQEVEKRWQKGNGYKKQKIYEDIVFYGWDNIKHEVLYENLSRVEAQQIEINLIKEYDCIENGYNISFGGGCGSDCWCEFEWDGIIYNSKELAEMSSLAKIDYHDITTRINSHSWSIGKALNTPKQRRGLSFEYKGEFLSIRELYERRINKDLTLNQIKSRILRHNWDAERAITQSNNKKNQPHGVGTCVFYYNGKEYNSWELCQISNVEGLTPQDITNRVNRRGWSVERAISQPKRKR